MTMSVTQVRLPQGLVKEIDKLLNKGFYSNKSDLIRDALRKLILEQQVGSIKKTSNSVKEVQEIRKILSQSKINLKEINSLNK